MYKLIIFVFLVFGLTSCNKDKIEVHVLPVSVYPNPFKDVFYISIYPNLGGSISSVKVLDGNKSIHEFKTISKPFNVAIDMRSHPKGIYHIELTIDGEKYIEPIIKVKTQ